MTEKDQADRDAEALLPCLTPTAWRIYDEWLHKQHLDCCWASKRPAVAAALRERDEEIEKLREEIKRLKNSQ